MDNKDIILDVCPICGGAGVLEHEGGWNVQVTCSDCSAHTVYVEYDSEQEKASAVKQVATLWNIGKVINSGAGD